MENKKYAERVVCSKKNKSQKMQKELFEKVKSTQI